jgi:DNA gyrase subunit A
MSEIEAAVEAPRPPSTVTIEQEMRRAYLDYAMSVIVARALPDVRDGLKPVHRRILFGMSEGGYHSNKPYKKSARIVGDVMGKYHPHGDSAIYDAMVRMAQVWSLRVTLVDGQGNFGSVDGDPPAAMRYTEARMNHAAHDMVVDLVAEKVADRKGRRDTIDFKDNYDGGDVEPVVLPARFPNLLVNGAEGIAVGMACKIPTHNLVEAVDASLLMLDNPDAGIDDILGVMPGPDFPTGGVILGRAAIRSYFETGRGSITLSGVATVEDAARGGRRNADRQRIVITQLPYQVVKERFVEAVAELVNEKDPNKRLEGIDDIRDESDSEGMSVVIDLKKGVDPAVVMAKLRKHTSFVVSYPVNNTCLNSRGKPECMPVKQMIQEFLDFRRQVVTRRTVFLLDQARDSLHRQLGLYLAISMVDEVVRLIRSSADADEARSRLMGLAFPATSEFVQLVREADPDASIGESIHLSRIQADAVLGLSLRRLTGLERDKIAQESRELSEQIRYYTSILGDPEVLKGVVRDELVQVRAKYPMPRSTVIEASEMDDVTDEDLVERKDIIVTVTRANYAKRTFLDSYREQARGGKGKTGMETRDDDFVIRTLTCTTRTPLIVITSQGQAFSMKAWRLPDSPPSGRGRPLQNILPPVEGETVAAILPLPEDRAECESKSILFVTDFGDIRRNDATDFLDIKRNGKVAIRLNDENGNPQGRLIDVLLCDDTDDVLIATRLGQVIRFPVKELRVFQTRTSTGVKGIKLGKDDAVINACVLPHSERSPDERTAYLRGGVAKTSERKPRAERGPPGPTNTVEHPWGRIVVSEREEDDEVVTEREVALSNPTLLAMQAEEIHLLTVSELGYGKRSSSFDFRVTGRGGKGIAAMDLSEQTGSLVACFPVTESDGLVFATDGGQMIRTRVSEISVIGRASRGVRLFRIPESQRIVDAAKVASQEAETVEPTTGK